MRCDFLLVTARAAVRCDQLSLLHVELPGFVDHPFMMPVTTQGIALVLLFQGPLPKRQYLSHS